MMSCQQCGSEDLLKSQPSTGKIIFLCNSCGSVQTFESIKKSPTEVEQAFEGDSNPEPDSTPKLTSKKRIISKPQKSAPEELVTEVEASPVKSVKKLSTVRGAKPQFTATDITRISPRFVVMLFGATVILLLAWLANIYSTNVYFRQGVDANSTWILLYIVIYYSVFSVGYNIIWGNKRKARPIHQVAEEGTPVAEVEETPEEELPTEEVEVIEQ